MLSGIIPFQSTTQYVVFGNAEKMTGESLKDRDCHGTEYPWYMMPGAGFE
jgi:hypothetical protein